MGLAHTWRCRWLRPWGAAGCGGAGSRGSGVCLQDMYLSGGAISFGWRRGTVPAALVHVFRRLRILPFHFRAAGGEPGGQGFAGVVPVNYGAFLLCPSLLLGSAWERAVREETSERAGELKQNSERFLTRDADGRMFLVVLCLWQMPEETEAGGAERRLWSRRARLVSGNWSRRCCVPLPTLRRYWRAVGGWRESGC
jgi:hypothetical protein